MGGKANYDIDKICANCELSRPVYDDGYVICEKRGVVYAAYRCRRFSYDLLKRDPKRMRISRDIDTIDTEGL